jgi:hypothetical protein
MVCSGQGCALSFCPLQVRVYRGETLGFIQSNCYFRLLEPKIVRHSFRATSGAFAKIK